MTTISAKIIADSISLGNKRLTTLELRYPRWIHAEFMTHRVFSRNAASSRAIPVKKLIQDVIDDPAVPLFWGKNQKGMQAGGEHDAHVTIRTLGVRISQSRESSWRIAMERAIEVALGFDDAGYHKQLVNRLLEPFSHITVVVTSTEWENFFGLRDDPAAEPHMQLLARRIKAAMETSSAKALHHGDWHLPYVSEDDRQDHCDPLISYEHGIPFDKKLVRLSVARCASTSYKTVDGQEMTFERAQEVYDKLLSAQPIHASPAEHQATPDTAVGRGTYDWSRRFLHGNFSGWIQYRKLLDNENIGAR